MCTVAELSALSASSIFPPSDLVEFLVIVPLDQCDIATVRAPYVGNRLTLRRRSEVEDPSFYKLRLLAGRTPIQVLLPSIRRSGGGEDIKKTAAFGGPPHKPALIGFVGRCRWNVRESILDTAIFGIQHRDSPRRNWVGAIFADN